MMGYFRALLTNVFLAWNFVVYCFERKNLQDFSFTSSCSLSSFKKWFSRLEFTVLFRSVFSLESFIHIVIVSLTSDGKLNENSGENRRFDQFDQPMSSDKYDCPCQHHCSTSNLAFHMSTFRTLDARPLDCMCSPIVFRASTLKPWPNALDFSLYNARHAC